MEHEVLDLAVIGGGAAGYFAALRAGDLCPQARIAIFEGGKRPLEKVRVSGGGRCNVTHHCFDPARLIENYPRGARELRGAFHRFQPKDTVAWFASKGVELKTEADGRMFPVTDSSETIISCLERERQRLGIELISRASVRTFDASNAHQFEFAISGSVVRRFIAHSVLLATGSARSGYDLAGSCGHSLSDIAPSLFTFTVEDPSLRALAGISVDSAFLKLVIDGKEVDSSSGPLLVTHWGLSGPAVLKLSAWAARELQASGYRAKLLVNWSGGETVEALKQAIAGCRQSQPRKSILNAPLLGLPSRLWEYLLRRGLADEFKKPWGELSRAGVEKLALLLARTELDIAGKGQFKEEFVTCGGVRLSEVDFRSMESKCRPGLFLAGEILDIDGVTGGFNFQSAWTAGWIAGSALGERLRDAEASKTGPR